jgi:hypothetical protein
VSRDHRGAGRRSLTQAVVGLRMIRGNWPQEGFALRQVAPYALLPRFTPGQGLYRRCSLSGQVVSSAASRTNQVNSGWTMSLCAPAGGPPARTTSLASTLSAFPAANR